MVIHFEQQQVDQEHANVVVQIRISCVCLCVLVLKVVHHAGMIVQNLGEIITALFVQQNENNCLYNSTGWKILIRITY